MTRLQFCASSYCLAMFSAGALRPMHEPSAQYPARVMSTSAKNGVEGIEMNKAQGGGAEVSESSTILAWFRPSQGACEQTCLSRSADCIARILTRSLFVLSMLALVHWLGGCGSLNCNPDPELAPSPKSDQVWTPPVSVTHTNDAASTLQQLRRFDGNMAPGASGTRAYDLPSLVDLALRTSPQTRHAWYTALEANAQTGQSEAPNYPKIEASAPGGYLKLPTQFPGQTLVIRQEAFLPQIKVSYDLLDFGRTSAAERSAREQLIAANFAFNQAIQDVVFNVEKAYYILSAANASVSAAEANLKLARTSLGAVQERHQVGLATEPQILLAKQVEAQAVYDLENVKSMVHDAEVGLRQAVGLAADTDISIQSSQLDQLPQNLGAMSRNLWPMPLDDDLKSQRKSRRCVPMTL